MWLSKTYLLETTGNFALSYHILGIKMTIAWDFFLCMGTICFIYFSVGLIRCWLSLIICPWKSDNKKEFKYEKHNLFRFQKSHNFYKRARNKYKGHTSNWSQNIQFLISWQPSLIPTIFQVIRPSTKDTVEHCYNIHNKQEPNFAEFLKGVAQLINDTPQYWSGKWIYLYVAIKFESLL